MNEKRRHNDTMKGQAKLHWPAIGLAITLGLAIFAGAMQMGSAEQKIKGNAYQGKENQNAIRMLLEAQNLINADQQKLNGRLVQGQENIQNSLREIKQDVRDLRRPR